MVPFCLKFGNAILKYGREHFLIESIFITNDKNIAIEKEKYFIKFYNAVKQGYNSSVGGEYGGNGINHADFNGENNPFFGKTHSLDSRKKISENHSSVPWLGGKTNGSFKKGKYHPKSIRITINNKTYDSIKIACEVLNMSRYFLLKKEHILFTYDDQKQ